MATRIATKIDSTLGDREITTADHLLLLELYKQVCDTWRDVSDLRFKLLGLLPIGTVAALIGLLSTDKLSPAIKVAFGVGGLLITIGLCIYEKNNDTNRKRLFERGRRIEFELGIKEGVFMKGGQHVHDEAVNNAQTRSKLVSNDAALFIIYGTCLLAWVGSLLLTILKLNH